MDVVGSRSAGGIVIVTTWTISPNTVVVNDGVATTIINPIVTWACYAITGNNIVGNSWRGVAVAVDATYIIPCYSVVGDGWGRGGVAAVDAMAIIPCYDVVGDGRGGVGAVDANVIPWYCIVGNGGGGVVAEDL